MAPADLPNDRDSAPATPPSGSAVVLNAPPVTHVLWGHALSSHRPHVPRDLPRVRGYDVIDVIGTGGMGVVYRARHRDLRRTVALKTIRPAALSDPEFLERFYAEAEAVARLQHPNIIQVFEIGTVEPHPGELHPGPFIALELVDGDSLAQRVTSPQTPELAARVVEKLARAAHAAHRLGIIHRDLKPSNVLMTRDGEPKIADFGLAKQFGAERDGSGRFVTQTGTVMGTPEYMAPEQAQGQALTPAVDIYALGVVLYELLTARVPFHAASPVETMNLVVRVDPVSPRRLRPALPRDLETICLKCLEKDPGKRYASAEALADDLRLFQEGRTIRARSVSSPERLMRWARRNPLPAALTLAVVVVGLIGLAGVLLKWREAERHAAAAEAATRAASDRARAERWERYRADIIASTSALQVDNVGSARRTLDATPEEHRDWEWRHLHSRLDMARHVPGVPDDTAHQAAMSAHGERVVVSGSKGIRVWDTLRRREMMSVPTVGGPDHLKISADGRTLAYRRFDTEVVLHDVDSDRVTAVLRGHGKTIHSITFVGNERLVTSGGTAGYRLWDVRRAKLIRQLTSDTEHAIMIGISADARQMLFCPAADRVIRVVDTDTGRVRHALHHGRKPAAGEAPGGHRAFFYPHNDRLLTIETYPGNAHDLWDAHTGRLISTARGHPNSVVDVAFSPDGSRIATGSRDHTVRLWDAATNAVVAVLRGHRGPVCRVSFSPDGKRLMSASEDHTLRLWDTASGELRAVLHGHTHEVISAAYTADGRSIVSVAQDGTIRLWDAQAVEKNGVLRGHGDFVYSVGFHPDGQRVASASWDGTARVWDATSGRQIHRLEHGKKAIVTAVAFDPTGKLLATRARDAVRLWDVGSGREVFRWDVPGDSWRDSRVAFNRDGTRLAAGCRGREVRIWDVASQAEVARLSGHRDEIRDLAFSPDGGLLATAGESGDRTVRIWDAARGEPVRVLEAHTNCVYAVAFNHDGTLLASGGVDGSVRLWDTATWKEAAVLQHGIKVGSSRVDLQACKLEYSIVSPK